ncbi:MAG TPA: outer membrane lipoprotein chaperone LolA [Gammaproteobacteria bacterium]
MALLLCGPMLTSGGTAAQALEPAVPAAGADHLRRFLDETLTFQATFEQQLLGPGREVIERATGTLSLKRPNRFLWSYDAPVEQLVVADGSDLWIYDVELAQATVTPLDDTVSVTPAMLLSGNKPLEDGFEILESFDADDLSWVRLVPKTQDTDFQEVLIGFRVGMLASLRLLDSLNQVTSIEFMNVELNRELDDSAFEFTPPPGVDVIGGRG